MKKIVALTGAGISAESGIKTFRDAGGLWEEYDIMEVATPEAWERNPSLVLGFYNKRRKQIAGAMPNAAHKALAELEKKYEVHIITQNIDDLHERAGSAKIMHLHGEIKKSRSSEYHDLVYEIKGENMFMGETCEKGFQLRPHIVWFGEAVPLMESAAEIISKASIVIVIGTSLEVHPAAGLIHYAPEKAFKYYIDPKAAHLHGVANLEIIRKRAGIGVPELVQKLLAE